MRAVVATGGGGGAAPFTVAVQGRCSELGATVAVCELEPSADARGEEEVQAFVAPALEALGGADVLAVDGTALFGTGGHDALLSSMQSTWELTRAVANEAMLQDGGGLVALIAPAPCAGAHAEAARAGLENLARTLSIEWARFGTRAVSLAAGDATTPAELADLVAYLASAAGAYYSGCQLDLRGV